MSPRAKFVSLNVIAWVMEIAAFAVFFRIQSQNGVFMFFTLLAVAFGIAVGSLFLNTSEVRVATTAEALIPYFIVLILGFILTPITPRRRSTRSACLSVTKQVAVAQLIYAADYDGHVPIALTWRDSIRPFVKPEDKYMKCPDSESPYSQAMNVVMSGVNAEKVEDPAKVVLLFECSSPEPNAIGTQNSFVRRHNERGAIARADSSVKFIQNLPGEAIWEPIKLRSKP